MTPVPPLSPLQDAPMVSPDGDPVLSTGRARSAVLSASVIARPNGRGKGPGAAHRAQAKKRRTYGGLYAVLYPHEPQTQPRRPCWLYEATLTVDLERVEALLSCPGIQVDAAFGGETSFVLAVRMLGRQREHPELQRRLGAMVGLLLAAGASPHAEVPGGVPLLALVRDQPEWATLLLKAGADPSRGSRTTPLMEALRAGDEENAQHWLACSSPSENPMAPNPWSVLMPRLLATHKKPSPFDPTTDVPPSWGNDSRRLAAPTSMDQDAAWCWAERLIQAGYGPDRPLQPWPRPKTAQEERDEQKGYGSRFQKVERTQDTPLIHACAAGCAATVDRLLALGANPHAWAPNGVHPFMAWVTVSMGRFVRLEATGISADEAAVLQQQAERFWTPELATATVPLWRGFPGYEEVHPLGSLLAGPCRSNDERVAELGWAWVDRLVDAGLRCPLPATPKDSSMVEQIVGLWVSAIRMSDDRDSGPFSDRFLGLLAALPGWREAQSTPCSDQWRMVPQAIRTVARCWRSPLMVEEIPLGKIALAGGDWAAYMATGHHPLLELCTTETYESSVDRDRPVPVAAVNFLLQQPFIRSDERQNALVALLTGPARSGTLEALACFEAAGCSVDALIAAHAPKMDAVLGREARASQQRLEEGLASKATSARPRARM